MRVLLTFILHNKASIIKNLTYGLGIVAYLHIKKSNQVFYDKKLSVTPNCVCLCSIKTPNNSPIIENNRNMRPIMLHMDKCMCFKCAGINDTILNYKKEQ